VMLTREVLVIVPVSDDALRRIAAVDQCAHVVDARGWFDVELREIWPPWTVQRYLGQRLGPSSSLQKRDQLLASAEIILGGFPFPLDLRARWLWRPLFSMRCAPRSPRPRAAEIL